MRSFKIDMSRRSSKTIFPRRINRINYLIRFLLFAAAMLAYYVCAIYGIDRLPENLSLAIFLPLLFLIFILRLPFMDIPRIRSAGYSPWLLLLGLIPGVGFILQILLFVIPPDDTW
jgi:uncharacterized membrane protein YhaH (DUF805 family)